MTTKARQFLGIKTEAKLFWDPKIVSDLNVDKYYYFVFPHSLSQLDYFSTTSCFILVTFSSLSLSFLIYKSNMLRFYIPPI